MQENYLAKWLNNELSEAELQEFKNSEAYKTYQKIAETASNLQAPEFDSARAYDAILNNSNASKPKVVRMRPSVKVWRIAAAIAVIFAASYFYINTLDENISTQFAERTEVTLPDNSEVVLNADTQISFDKDRWEKERNVKLDGEAFFKVAKGMTFTVSTDAGLVKVLGTQFNVESRKNFFEVSCYEGVVNVTYNNKDTRLTAGQSFLVIDGKIVDVNLVQGTVPSWIQSESTFKSIPLVFVLNELERQYDIKVTTENVDLTQLFTGTFSNTNLNLALESISTPTRIAYDVQGSKVHFYAKNTP